MRVDVSFEHVHVSLGIQTACCENPRARLAEDCSHQVRLGHRRRRR